MAMVFALLSLALLEGTLAYDNGVAMTPPMGWNCETTALDLWPPISVPLRAAA